MTLPLCAKHCHRFCRMKYQYQTTGTCSKFIEFEIDNDNIIHNVIFYGGCNGNLQGIRFIVNTDYSQPLYPAKTYPRSETVDFQRGEVEWRGGNLYFGRWNYDMELEVL